MSNTSLKSCSFIVFVILGSFWSLGGGASYGQTSQDAGSLIYQGYDPSTYFALEKNYPKRNCFSVTAGKTEYFKFEIEKCFYPVLYAEVHRGGHYLQASIGSDGQVMLVGAQAQPMKSAADSLRDSDGYLPVYKDLAGAEVHIKMKNVEAPIWKFNVMILPQRTVPVNIYWICDSTSSKTTVTRNVATEQAIIRTLNQVFAQAGIKFQLGEAKSIDYPFDTDKKGNLQIHSNGDVEIVKMLKCSASYKPVDIMLLANSDREYVPGSPASGHARGSTGMRGVEGPTEIMQMWTIRLFLNNLNQTGMDIGSAAAHELGHVFGIPPNSTDKVYGYVADGAHYIGPVPDGEYKGVRHLMESGFNRATQVQSTAVDHWLSHRDWYYANIQATNNESK